MEVFVSIFALGGHLEFEKNPPRVESLHSVKLSLGHLDLSKNERKVHDLDNQRFSIKMTFDDYTIDGYHYLNVHDAQPQKSMENYQKAELR